MGRPPELRGRHGSAPEQYAPGSEPDFSFIPEELAGKCERMIRAYHAMPGAPRLADLIWHSEARAFIRSHEGFNQILTNSTKVRSAKRVNDSLRIVAKVILALELLVNNIAGWGTRFPDAKRQAQKILGQRPFTSRVWLMDYYLYQSLDPRRYVARMLEPP
jgi:hypothetical protein